MALRIQTIPGALKRFSRPSGTYQHTFRTPLDRLPVFVAALLAGAPPITAGTVTVKAVVSTPRHLASLLAVHDLPQDVGPDTTVTASGAEEVRVLLAATLADWLDFYFLPKPNRFLVYADHDEYTTVFSARRTAVSRIAAAMAVAGIADVPGYSRDV
jgi:hypothetical protein